MAQTTVNGLSILTTTVNLNATPVSLIPPGFLYAGLNIRNRSSSGQAVLIFPYVGTLPTTAPSNVYELGIGATYSDNLASASSGADSGLEVGWAAVLEAAGASATVDAVWR